MHIIVDKNIQYDEYADEEISQLLQELNIDDDDKKLGSENGNIIYDMSHIAFF